MIKNCFQKNDCRVCDNDNLQTVIDLGEQAPANAYYEKKENIELKYPLKLNICDNCWHMQLSHVISPEILFKNYTWMSGISKEMKEYFKQFALYCHNSDKTLTVLEIACNDGSQLDAFKNLGYKTIGVDPAENFKKLNEKKGHVYIDSFFNESLVEKLKMYGSYSIIVAQNVFGHIDDLNSFLQTVKKLMDKDTTLYIQTSQANMIDNGEFDTIYHEHLSFFSVMSMRICLEKNGLILQDAELIPVHGISYLFTICVPPEAFSSGGCGHIARSPILDLECKEYEERRYKIETYKKFSTMACNRMENFNKKIENFIKDEYMVVGYGASAKANVFLTSSKINLSYIIDDNILKQNKLSPNTGTPIISLENFEKILLQYDKIVIVILAWNIKEELKINIKLLCDKLKINIPIMFEY